MTECLSCLRAVSMKRVCTCQSPRSSCEAGAVIVPIPQVGKPRHRQVKLLAYNHIATKVEEGSSFDPRNASCGLYFKS